MFVGKFNKYHDEEYIARALESLGHDLIRVEQSIGNALIHRKLVLSKPDLLLFSKWDFNQSVLDAIKKLELEGMKSVCWLFDLFIGYERESRIKTSPYFKAQYVFSTDGGHDKEWKAYGINHTCVRQGIADDECVLLPLNNPDRIVFVGSDNPFYQERTKMMEKLQKDYFQFKWLGKSNTDSIRGMRLNELYASTRVVVGDSVYSPHYWSNRVVETLGRGGFLIHREVEGIKEAYPDLVTYDGTYENLKRKINYYLEHEDERLEIVKKNFEHVKNNYTIIKQCNKLLSCLNQ